jgi:hypothetical protein
MVTHAGLQIIIKPHSGRGRWKVLIRRGETKWRFFRESPHRSSVYKFACGKADDISAGKIPEPPKRVFEEPDFDMHSNGWSWLTTVATAR